MELPSKKSTFQKTESPDNSKAKKAPLISEKKTESEIIVNKNPNVQGILPSTVLSKEDKDKIDKLKAKKQKIACLLKQIATILGITIFLWFIFIRASISENNSFLSKIGIDENLGKQHQELESKNMQLEMNSYELDEQIKEIKQKIDNKYYTLFSKDIKTIKENQITWFDIFDKNNELSIGIIDGVRRIAEYFNDNGYADPKNIISGAHEKMEVNNIKASREKISFSINNTQILGRIIFMDIETIDVLNSFPIYKNGKGVTSFSRDKNEDGDYYNEFSLSFDIQNSKEKDSADDRFIEYLNWLKKKYPNIKIKEYQNNN